jgi:hypothetical protein
MTHQRQASIHPRMHSLLLQGVNPHPDTTMDMCLLPQLVLICSLAPHTKPRLLTPVSARIELMHLS